MSSLQIAWIAAQLIVACMLLIRPLAKSSETPIEFSERSKAQRLEPYIDEISRPFLLLTSFFVCEGPASQVQIVALMLAAILATLNIAKLIGIVETCRCFSAREHYKQKEIFSVILYLFGLVVLVALPFVAEKGSGNDRHSIWIWPLALLTAFIVKHFNVPQRKLHDEPYEQSENSKALLAMKEITSQLHGDSPSKMVVIVQVKRRCRECEFFRPLLLTFARCFKGWLQVVVVSDVPGPERADIPVEWIEDQEGIFSRALGLQRVPAAVIYNRDQEIIEHKTVYGSAAVWQALFLGIARQQMNGAQK
jgi:hypothetical protein